MPNSRNVAVACARGILSSRWIACIVLLLATVSAQATRYVYDDAGRVIGVVNQAGQAARFQYDAVGNLIAVAAPTANALAFAMQPDHGPPGTAVRIIGNALPTSPALQVMFSGATPVTPTAATPQEIQFTVPAVALGTHALTLESLGNTLPLGNFEVTTGLGPPTIASVSHSCALFDAVVSLTGSGFDSRPNATRVEVGNRLARITSITETTLSFRAPQHTPGGPVRVVTDGGTAQSSSILYLVSGSGNPCTGFTAGAEAQVDGAAVSTQLSTANPMAEYAFYAQRGQWVSVHFTSADVTSINTNLQVKATIFDPEGRKIPLLNGAQQPVEFLNLSGAAMSAHPMVVARSGIHVLQLAISGTTARNLGFRIINSPRMLKESTATYQTAPGQSVRMIYSAQAGDQLGVGLQAQNTTSDTMNSSFYVYATDHAYVTPETGSDGFCSENATCSFNLKTFAIAGEYPFAWYPQSFASNAQATVWFSDDQRQQLQPQLAQSIAITRPGQNARFPIVAAAGSGFSINVRNLNMPGSNTRARVWVIAPDGSSVATKSTYSSGAGSDQFPAPGTTITAFQLTQTGTYTAMFDPVGGVLATGEIMLDPGQPLTYGEPIHVDESGIGFARRFVINGIAAQKLGVGLTNIQLTPNSISYTLQAIVYLPSGESLGTLATCYQQSATRYGCEFDLGPLPVTGAYIVVVQGAGGVTAASYDIQASLDVGADLMQGAESVAITNFGGNARVYFDAVPGAAQTLHFDSQIANPAGGSVYYSVLRPDGFPLIAPLYVPGTLTGSASGAIRIGDFPLAGRYTMFVDPVNAVVAQFEASVTPGALDNAPIPVLQSVVPGPWYASAFTAAAGSHPSVGVSIQNLANRNDNYLKIEVVDPLDRRLIEFNTTQPFASCYTVNQNYCDFDLFNASVTGTYQVVVWPGTPTRQDAQITVATASDLEVSGRDGTFVLTSPGQNARLNFSAVSGDRFNLVLTRLVSGNPASMVSFHLLDAAGYRISGGSMSESASTYTVSLPTIPYSGNFSIVLDTSNGTPASLRAQLIAL